MNKYEYHIQTVEVTGEYDEFTVVRLATHAPWTTDEELSFDAELDPYDVEWWQKKSYEASGQKYIARKETDSCGPRLVHLLELYDHYGWEHYNSLLTSKQHPELAENPDFATLTLILFFRRPAGE